MSTNSLPLNDPPRQVLREIVTRYGTSLCDNPSQAEGLLCDLCGEYRREINLLMSALKDKVPADLLSTSVTPAELLIGRLTTRLRDNHSLTDDAARWAVESWAFALGRISQNQLTSPSATPQTGPSSAISQPKSLSFSAAAVPVASDLTEVPRANGSVNSAQVYSTLPNSYGPASNPGSTPPQYSQQVSSTAPFLVQPPRPTWPPSTHTIKNASMNPYGNTSGTLGPPPQDIEINRWNWGAFLWNWLWLCLHGRALLGLGLLISCFIPVINFASFGAAVYLGIYGNKLAWEGRQFRSSQEFTTVQKAWGTWGFLIIFGSLGLYVVGLILFGIGAALFGGH